MTDRKKESSKQYPFVFLATLLFAMKERKIERKRYIITFKMAFWKECRNERELRAQKNLRKMCTEWRCDSKKNRESEQCSPRNYKRPRKIETNINKERKTETERAREFQPCHYETNFKCHRPRQLISCLQVCMWSACPRNKRHASQHFTPPHQAVRCSAHPTSETT